MQANYAETRRPYVLNRNLTLKDQKEKKSETTEERKFRI